MSLVNKLSALRDLCNTGITRPFDYRKKQLQKLKAVIEKYEQQLYNALHEDLKKSPEESFVTENGFLLSEIKYAIHHLFEWMQPQKVSTNLMNLPSKSFVLQEPLGVVMIIGPWNYPVQLILAPLVSAIAAGNTVVVKCSEHAPHSEQVLEALIQSTFEPAYIRVLKGPGEVVVADSTSVNLFKVLSAALALQRADAPGRSVIVSERSNFPTDLYIAESLGRQHGCTLRLVDRSDDIPAALDGSTVDWEGPVADADYLTAPEPSGS
mgnify:CR=1 FL=1